MEEARKVIAEYNFSRTEIVQSQDHFADPHNNPNGTYLSTNMAFWDGVFVMSYDYVVNVPIEFFAENTDTMFYHAMANFEFFDDYDVYETVDYPGLVGSIPENLHPGRHESDLRWVGCR